MVICDYTKVTKSFHFRLANNIGAYLMNYYFCFNFFMWQDTGWRCLFAVATISNQAL